MKCKCTRNVRFFRNLGRKVPIEVLAKCRYCYAKTFKEHADYVKVNGSKYGADHPLVNDDMEPSDVDLRLGCGPPELKKSNFAACPTWKAYRERRRWLDNMWSVLQPQGR